MGYLLLKFDEQYSCYYNVILLFRSQVQPFMLRLKFDGSLSIACCPDLVITAPTNMELNCSSKATNFFLNDDVINACATALKANNNSSKAIYFPNLMTYVVLPKRLFFKCVTCYPNLSTALAGIELPAIKIW